MGYAETYRRSLERPEEFWAQAAETIDWERRWDRVLDANRPPLYRWFAGAKLTSPACNRGALGSLGSRLAGEPKRWRRIGLMV